MFKRKKYSEQQLLAMLKAGGTDQIRAINFLFENQWGPKSRWAKKPIHTTYSPVQKLKK